MATSDRRLSAAKIVRLFAIDECSWATLIGRWRIACSRVMANSHIFLQLDGDLHESE
jgi:hypothetical protein